MGGDNNAMTNQLMNPLGIGNKDMSMETRVINILTADATGMISGAAAPGFEAIGDKWTGKKDEVVAQADPVKSIEQAAAEAEALALEEAKMEARKKLAYQTQTVFSSKFNSSLGNTSTLGSN